MRKLLIALLSLALTSSVGAQSCCDHDGFRSLDLGMIAPFPNMGTSTPAFATACTIDAANEKCAWVLQAPKTGTITNVHYLTGTVTVGDVADVRIETVDTTAGDPTGTLEGTDTNCASTIADNDDNVWKDCDSALTGGASVTRGDFIAVVVAGSVTATENYTIQKGVANNQISNDFPYTDEFTTAWAKTAGLGLVVALEYSDGTFGSSPMMFPGTPATLSVANNTDPDEVGVMLNYPFPYRIGCAYINTNANAADYEVVVYNGASTAMQTISIDDDRVVSAAANEAIQIVFPEVSCQAGEKCRVVVKPSSTTAISLYDTTTSSAAMRRSFPGATYARKTSRVDAGAWTDTETNIINMGVCVSAVRGGP